MSGDRSVSSSCRSLSEEEDGIIGDGQCVVYRIFEENGVCVLLPIMFMNIQSAITEDFRR